MNCSAFSTASGRNHLNLLFFPITPHGAAAMTLSSLTSRPATFPAVIRALAAGEDPALVAGLTRVGNGLPQHPSPRLQKQGV